MCMDDNDKYKLYGQVHSNNMGSIQLEVSACDPSAREDPDSCVSDEAELREYMALYTFRVGLLTNWKEYDTHEY